MKGQQVDSFLYICRLPFRKRICVINITLFYVDLELILELCDKPININKYGIPSTRVPLITFNTFLRLFFGCLLQKKLTNIIPNHFKV